MDTATLLHNTLTVLETLVPIAATVIATVGGVSVPIVGGIAVAKMLLPIADEFVMKIGTKDFSLDTSQLNSADDIKALLTADIAKGFPVLAFK